MSFRCVRIGQSWACMWLVGCLTALCLLVLLVHIIVVSLRVALKSDAIVVVCLLPLSLVNPLSWQLLMSFIRHVNGKVEI